MSAKSSLVLLGCLLVALTRLGAVDLTFPITSQTVGDWTVTGADKASLTSAPLVVLPAGAQLARNFNARDIAINFDAAMAFNSDPADWAVFEIGSAALVFVRNGDLGGLKLILGDKGPITLPYGFKLDESGRNADQVHLTFAITGGLVTINVQGKTLTFPDGSIEGSSPEVVASAGGSSELPLTNFEVVVPSDGSPANGSSKNSASDQPVDTSQPKTAGTNISVPGTAPTLTGDTSSTSDGKLVTDSSAAKPAQKMSLVVFTPPSFRHGRADALRASATAAQK